MRIAILGTELPGVRGLTCVVSVKGCKIVIDPGLALGYRRHGSLLHSVQVAVGEQVRDRMITALKDATDLVISHFHRLLEAQRAGLYRKMPVPEGWYEAYARGETNTSGYSDSVCGVHSVVPRTNEMNDYPRFCLNELRTTQSYDTAPFWVTPLLRHQEPCHQRALNGCLVKGRRKLDSALQESPGG